MAFNEAVGVEVALLGPGAEGRIGVEGEVEVAIAALEVLSLLLLWLLTSIHPSILPELRALVATAGCRMRGLSTFVITFKFRINEGTVDL